MFPKIEQWLQNIVSKNGHCFQSWAKKVGNGSRTLTKKEAMAPELGQINRAMAPEFG